MELSKESETLDEEWKQLEESILNNVVLIHSQLFGSGDLVQTVSPCSLVFPIDLTFKIFEVTACTFICEEFSSLICL